MDKKIITQKKIAELVEESLHTDPENISIWFWIALVQMIFLVFLVFKLKNKSANHKFKSISKDKIRDMKSSDIDMGDLMDSINSSKELYRQLSKQCHPDKFINSQKQKKAEIIFQEITNNKRNYKNLLKLKHRASEELEINFKIT
jgi:hypothetical protein